MTQFGCLVAYLKPYGEVSDWEWVGIYNAPDPEVAASNLAVDVMGYEPDNYSSETELIEQFIDDGWRFKLLEINMEIDNTEIA